MSAADKLRSRQVAARKALKGEDAPAPASTLNATTIDTTTGNNPPSADDALIEDFIAKTRNQGPMPWSPFTRIDVLVLIAIFVLLYYFILINHKIDLWPHIWHYIGPHYDHHDDPNYAAPDLPDRIWDL